jgi:anaerobic dimethyl sulfoxide reductase subunit B
MAKQLAFYLDTTACTRCKTCQIACKDKNDTPPGVLWRRVFQYGGGSWVKQDAVLVPNNVFSYAISIACMHCEDPICVEVCPTGASIKRHDGVVYVDQNVCIGCRYCEWACPYGARHFDQAKGSMTKCDFCRDLLDQGKNPACVDACNMRCLKFGELEELRREYGDLAAIEPLPSADLTQPAFVITPHKHAQLSGNGTGRILNMPEEV